MAFAPYCTGGDLLNFMQVTGAGKADLADAAAIATSHAVDEYCQRNFWQDTAAARTFVPNSWWCLNLGPFNDLVSVTAVKTDGDGDGTFETTWTASDYQLAPTNLPLGRPFTEIRTIGSQTFPVWCGFGTARLNRVQITGTWGWAAVPSEVVYATKVKAGRLYMRHQSVNGVAGAGDFGPIRVSQFEDPDVVSLLAPYRHPSTAVLVA